jgi:hypothetical protein
MPIPALNEDGFLPPGVHECTLEELQQRFGTFQGSDWRQKLFARLAALVDSVRRSGLFCAIVVNGSFVTSKQQPNDVDLVLVLKSGHDFLAEVTPVQYNLLHSQAVQRRFGFDSFLAEEGTDDYVDAVEFFQRVKHRDGGKGILRVNL